MPRLYSTLSIAVHTHRKWRAAAGAIRALATIDSRIEGHAITLGKAAPAGADPGDCSRGFMPHHEGRNAASGGSVIAVDVTAADAAGCHPDQYFARTWFRHRHIRQFELAVLREQECFHFGDFTCADGGVTIPLPSRMVMTWFAFPSVKRSIGCVIGHFTSTTSMPLVR